MGAGGVGMAEGEDKGSREGGEENLREQDSRDGGRTEMRAREEIF